MEKKWVKKTYYKRVFRNGDGIWIAVAILPVKDEMADNQIGWQTIEIEILE